MPNVTPGECRHCGCTDQNACKVPPTGDPCCWIDLTFTVCSNPDCIRAEQKRLKDLRKLIFKTQNQRERDRRQKFRSRRKRRAA